MPRALWRKGCDAIRTPLSACLSTACVDTARFDARIALPVKRFEWSISSQTPETLALQGVRHRLHNDVRMLVHKRCGYRNASCANAMRRDAEMDAQVKRFLRSVFRQTPCGACTARGAAMSPHRCPQACPQAMWIVAIVASGPVPGAWGGDAETDAVVKKNVW